MDKRYTVLFIFHESTSSGGATYSGMNMIKALDRKKIIPLVLLPGEGDVKKQLEAIGVKCVVAPVDVWFRTNERSFFLHHQFHRFLRLKTKIENLIQDYLVVKQELKDYHIDIVHSNTAAIMAGYALAKFLHCKHVWHLREFIDLDFHERPYMGFWLLRKIVNSADATISITNAVRLHWMKRKTNYAFLYFDAVKSEKTLDSVILPKEKFFLFCANLVAQYKGANWAMKAFCLSRLFEDGYKLKFPTPIK